MKKIFFTLVALVAGIASQAQTITEHMARTMAIEFVQQKQITVAPQAEMVYRECGTKDATPEVYLMRVGNVTKHAANFVIVAADAGVENPILGYGFNADIDLDNAPENFKWWIRQYALQIEYAKENGLLTATNATAARYGVRKATGMGTVVVPPLLGDTRWHQDAPYNNLCPTDTKTSERCVVGCVATAMSQIMYYHKWPLQGTGKHKDQSTKTEEVDFSQSFYDWKNILPSYNKSATTAQCTAVAKLCYDCGVAVDMQYGSEGSGALSSDVPYAMKTYFKYKQVSNKSRGSATTTWDNTLKDELKAGRPVFYSGNDGTYGHAFVCDGYDSNNYFHFNWGWTGSCNGYFKTSALKTDQGAFNYGQAINYNIQPNRTATVVDGLTYNLRNDSTAELTKKNGGFYSGDIEIPATITVGSIEYTVNTIGAYAFGNCNDLTSVTLSESITTITASAFCNCSSLDKIVMPFTKPIEISTGAFSSDIYNHTTLVVPDNCIKNYSGAAPWFHFTYYSTPSTQFETEQYWTAWEPYLNGFGTWTYYNDPTIQTAGTQHTNLRIFHRTSTSDATTQQFWIQSWSCDGDLLINYDEKTGNCVIPKAYTGYQAYDYGKIYASDCHEYSSSYTYKQYPCTFNKANGTFTLNMIYFISQGSFPRDGVETFKVDGSADFSFEVAVGDIKLNETDGSGTSTLTFTEGKDVKYKKFYSVRRELNAKQVDTTMNRILSGAIEAEKLTKNTYTFKMPREGVYELFFCVYDSLDKCQYTTHNTLKFYTETGWTNLGKCDYTDDVITTTFSTKLSPAGPYKVEIFQNNLNKGILRLKHPYGTTFPYAKNGNYTKETLYVDINVEDPEGVYIEYQSTGKDLQKKGVYSFIYSKAAEALDAGTSLEDVKKMGVCGTFDGRTITFPANAVYCDKYFTSEYTEANRNAAFKVDLSQLPVGIFDLNQQNENTLYNIDAPIYNLAGQRVSKDYKGLLIHNGRKIIVK